MRTIRFHEYGEARDVLRLEQTDAPAPRPGRIRIAVHACALNPADWALCKGLFAGLLPRGIGIEVSGTVDAIGPGVTDVAIGDRVFGTADWAKETTAGAADHAIMDHWARVPPGLDLVQAAALPMAIHTVFHSIDLLGVAAGQTLLVSGAGTMMGFAAVQMGLARGARVIATAGATYADRLRSLGAAVTAYGAGMVERVRELAGGAPDLVLNCAPPTGALPDLVAIAGGDPRRVLTITDFAGAEAIGARHNATGGRASHYDMLGEYAERAAAGTFTIPIAKTFALEAWREAVAISQSGHAHGKLVLLLDAAPPAA